MTRLPCVLAVAGCLLLPAAFLSAEETTPPATTAAAPASVDLSTAEKALGSYFKAESALDEKGLEATSVVSDDALASLAEVMRQFALAQAVLERAAVAQFGPKEGLKVIGRPRSAEDQTQINLKRLRDPVVETTDDTDVTRVTLKPDLDPLPDYKTEDIFYLRHIGETWKVDYVMTYHLNDPERADSNKFNLAIYPRMIVAMQKIAEDVKAGKYKQPEDAAAAFNRAWDGSLPENQPKDK